MKKQTILATTLALAIAGGSLFAGGGISTFAETNQPQTADINPEVGQAMILNVDEYANDLVKEGIISKAEAEKMLELEEKLNQLFDKEAEKTKPSPEFDTKSEKIYQELDPIYEKIDSALFYSELEENGVLSKSEIEQYKKAEAALAKLYADENEANFQQNDKEIEKIYAANKSIYDKVDMYFTQQDKMQMKNYYQELEKSGVLSKNEIEQYKKAEAEIEKLYQEYDEQNWEEIDKKVEKIYQDNKAIYDKVDSHNGSCTMPELTDEQKQQLKIADQQAEKLIKDFNFETASEEEHQKLEEAINKLYEGFDFLEEAIAY